MATKDGDLRKKGPTVIAKGEVKVWKIKCTGEGGHPRHANERGNYLPGTGCGADLQVSIEDLFTMKTRDTKQVELCFECPEKHCHSITRIPEEDVRTLDPFWFEDLQTWKCGYDD